MAKAESTRNISSPKKLMNIQNENDDGDYIHVKQGPEQMNWLTKSDINFFKKEASNAGSEVLSDLVNDT